MMAYWGNKENYIILLVREPQTLYLRMNTHRVNKHFKKCKKCVWSKIALIFYWFLLCFLHAILEKASWKYCSLTVRHSLEELVWKEQHYNFPKGQIIPARAVRHYTSIRQRHLINLYSPLGWFSYESVAWSTYAYPNHATIFLIQFLRASHTFG